jgi:hypothetical protein
MNRRTFLNVPAGVSRSLLLGGTGPRPAGRNRSSQSVRRRGNRLRAARAGYARRRRRRSGPARRRGVPAPSVRKPTVSVGRNVESQADLSREARFTPRWQAGAVLGAMSTPEVGPRFIAKYETGTNRGLISGAGFGYADSGHTRPSPRSTCSTSGSGRSAPGLFRSPDRRRRLLRRHRRHQDRRRQRQRPSRPRTEWPCPSQHGRGHARRLQMAPTVNHEGNMKATPGRWRSRSSRSAHPL